MLTDKLKLVVWDLDDTFWQGTLAEGGVVIPAENAHIVKTLAERGVVSSISSKNDYEDVKAVLEGAGLWRYFIFPHIEFAPKGSSIADLIERMNLRPENVLFIDDNPLNLQEARYFCPGLMVAHPDKTLPHLLASPHAQGKDDSSLSRLAQYKQLETKFTDRRIASGSNEDFLRQCQIKVEIDADVESQLDRVIELINRTNQLNYTKLRLDTDNAVARFRAKLREYGHLAGVVKASDKYGDYGVVGFYMTQRSYSSYLLHHFVFSCRIMNMGIEQYVYQRLGRPDLTVVEPVANGLDVFPAIDWISDDAGATTAPDKLDEHLLLLGGCDLLQVATYCSNNRTEFVNAVNRDVMVRYDDPGFVLSSRKVIAESKTLDLVPCWRKDDVAQFDARLPEAVTLIVSLWEAMDGHFLVIDNAVVVRVDTRFLGKHLAKVEQCPYLDVVQMSYPDLAAKLELIRLSFVHIARSARAARSIFILSAPLRGCKPAEREARELFNRQAQSFCSQSAVAELVAIDDIVPESEILDGQHFSRKGYFAIASHLMQRSRLREQPALARTE